MVDLVGGGGDDDICWLICKENLLRVQINCTGKNGRFVVVVVEWFAGL